MKEPSASYNIIFNSIPHWSLSSLVRSCRILSRAYQTRASCGPLWETDEHSNSRCFMNSPFPLACVTNAICTSIFVAPSSAHDNQEELICTHPPLTLNYF